MADKVEKTETSQRIQKSLLNGVEHKILVWLAARQPRWMTSNILTAIGVFGSVVIAAGYILSNKDINWLWLASLGFVINWYGDSLDGNLARFRNTQRPIYGYYLDHTVDAVNEICMFIGIGLSSLVNIWITVAALVVYLLLTINVGMNAHLKKEFKLTYAKFGPTELRLALIIVNTIFIFVPAVREFRTSFSLCGSEITFGIFDYVAGIITIALTIVYISEVIRDLREYARIDPPKKWNG